MKIDPIQIAGEMAYPLKVLNFAASGTSNTVTTVVSNVLATAGKGGTQLDVIESLPLGVVGIITTGANNDGTLVTSATGLPIEDDDSNEVFCRLTYNGSNYILSYYTSVNGVETAFTMPSQNINFTFNYNFKNGTEPYDALIKTLKVSFGANQDAKSYDFDYLIETATLTADNTFQNPVLTYPPKSGSAVTMSVNGIEYYSGEHFTLTSQSVTISAGNLANLGFDILNENDINGEPKFVVKFKYFKQKN